MSIQQYHFNVIPTDSITDAVLEDLKNCSFEDGVDTEPAWLQRPVARESFSSVQHILAKGKSWSTNLDIYGDLESNCFEVGSKDGTVVDVSFRIDFTTDYESILERLIEYCILNGLSVLSQDWELLPLNFLSLNRQIQTCPQVAIYDRLADVPPER